MKQMQATENNNLFLCNYWTLLNFCLIPLMFYGAMSIADLFLSQKRHGMQWWDLGVSASFYSQPVRLHYYKPYWFPDFHLICLRDALLLTLYDLILFYWTCIVLLWQYSLLQQCNKFHSFNMKSWITLKSCCWAAQGAQTKFGAWRWGTRGDGGLM